jgi:hypothetical protein
MKPENFRNFGTREMTLGDKGFLLKTDACETFWKWKNVSGVVKIQGYCFIDIAGQETLIIPTGRLTREEAAKLENILNKFTANPAAIANGKATAREW